MYEDPYDHYTSLRFEYNDGTKETASIRQKYSPAARPLKLFCVHVPANSNAPQEGNFQSAEDTLKEIATYFNNGKQITSITMDGISMLTLDQAEEIIFSCGIIGITPTIGSVL